MSKTIAQITTVQRRSGIGGSAVEDGPVEFNDRRHLSVSASRRLISLKSRVGSLAVFIVEEMRREH